jgi:hypothetical protein
MAIQSRPRSGGAAGLGGEFGGSIGNALSSGLQALAHSKMQQVQERHAQQQLGNAFSDLPESSLAFINSLPPKEKLELLKELGNQRLQESSQAQQKPMNLESVTPEQKEGLRSYLQSPEAQQAHSPEELQKIAQFLDQGNEQGGIKGLQQQLGNNPVGVNPFGEGQSQVQPQQPSQVQPPAAEMMQQKPKGLTTGALGKGSAESLAREKQDLAREKFEFEKQQAKEKMAAAIQESEDTPAQKKYKEEVTSAYSLYDDLLETSKRMLKNSQENGVSTGFISNLQYGIDPSTLDDATEAFAKDSDHIVNLTSTGLKGVMSKYRVQKLEAEKPSLRHGKKVNEDILKTYIEKAEHKLKQIEKDNPKIKFDRIQDEAQEEQELALKDPLAYPQFFDDNTKFDPEDGSGKIYILKNGVWEEE